MIISRLRLTRSSNAIQQCDNHISANKNWFASQLKSGSSCYWKGLFDNVIELYQQEIMHGNINNHKVIIFSSPTLHQRMLEVSGWSEKKAVIWCCCLRAAPHGSHSLRAAWLLPETVPSQLRALLAVSNADIHSKARGTCVSNNSGCYFLYATNIEGTLWCDVWPIKRKSIQIWFRSWAGCINISCHYANTQPKSSFQTQTQQPESKKIIYA